MSFDFKAFFLISVKFYGLHPCNPYHRGCAQKWSFKNRDQILSFVILKQLIIFPLPAFCCDSLSYFVFSWASRTVCSSMLLFSSHRKNRFIDPVIILPSQNEVFHAGYSLQEIPLHPHPIGWYYWLVSPKYVQVLTSKNIECDFILKQDLSKGH